MYHIDDRNYLADRAAIENRLEKIYDDDYEQLCDHMLAIMRQEKELAAHKALIRDEIIKASGGDRMQYGINVQRCEGRETIDWKRLAEDLHLDDAFLSRYKSKGSDFWQIRNLNKTGDFKWRITSKKF